MTTFDFSQNLTTSSHDLDDHINQKLSTRQAAFNSQKTYPELMSSIMNSDRDYGNSIRAKHIRNLRLKSQLKIENNKSLSNHPNSLPIYADLIQRRPNPSSFEEFVEKLRSSYLESQLEGLVNIRLILTLTSLPQEKVMEYNIISDLISFLDSPYPEFVYESLWSLTNISIGNQSQSQIIASNQGLDKIARVLDMNIEEVKIQAIWLLGNLGVDSKEIRNELFTSNILRKIISIFSTTENPKIAAQCVWTLYNLARTKPSFPEKYLLSIVDKIVKWIVTNKDNDTFLLESCSFLSFITETCKKSFNCLIDIDLLSQLLTLLDSNDKTIKMIMLRAFGNIATGDANQTQHLIELGLLKYLKKTIKDPLQPIRKETAWIISNVAAGTQKQIVALLNENFYDDLVQIIKNDSQDIVKEACWGICNLSSVGDKELMESMLNREYIEVLSSIIKSNELKLIAIGIEALENVLEFGNQYYAKDGEKNIIVKRLEDIGMFDVFERLQYHCSEIIYEKVVKLIDNYFEKEELD